MSSTINDVAKLAGISRQTVSRVLNEPSLVNPQTLQKVKKAMELLDYHPNITARNLVNNVVRTIGLFMPFSVNQVRQNLFFSTISATICHYCAEKNFVLQLFTAMPTEDYSTLFKKLHREKRVGGLILTCPSVNNKEIVDLLAAKVPFILIGRPGIPMDEISFVDGDNVQAAYIATRHLLSLGHERICLLNAPKNMTLSEDFKKGMEKAFEDSALPTGGIIEAHTDLTLDAGYSQAIKVLSNPHRPTAIVTADDLLAVAVKKATDQKGMTIPDDLSLVSLARTGWGDLLPFALTCVDIQFENLGIIAADHIMKMLKNKSNTSLHEVLSATLVQGESCQSPN